MQNISLTFEASIINASNYVFGMNHSSAHPKQFTLH